MYHRTNNQKFFQTFRFVDHYKISYTNQFLNYLKIEKSIAMRCILTKILKNIIMHSIESKYNARNTLHVNKNSQKHYHALNRVKVQRWEKILDDEFLESKNVENFAIQKSIDCEYQFYWFKTFTIKRISIIFKFKTKFYAREHKHLFQFIKFFIIIILKNLQQ